MSRPDPVSRSCGHGCPPGCKDADGNPLPSYCCQGPLGGAVAGGFNANPFGLTTPPCPPQPPPNCDDKFAACMAGCQPHGVNPCSLAAAGAGLLCCAGAALLSEGLALGWCAVGLIACGGTAHEVCEVANGFDEYSCLGNCKGQRLDCEFFGP